MADKSNSRCWLVALMLLLLIWCASTTGKTIYVDDDAVGANNGSSWENAYIHLQDALADANAAEKPVEIRVAQGVYTPDQGVGITRGDKGAAFQLINGVTVLGGFAGVGAIEPDDRNIEAYKTILSGDLAGDDADIEDPEEFSGHPTRAENSNTVVRGKETDQTAVLDGITVTAGENDMVNDRGDPTVVNCTFTESSTGMYNHFCSPGLTNCTFNGLCDHAIFQVECSLPLTNCMFTANMGGAIDCLSQAELTLQDCTFIDNDLSLPIISCFKQKNLRMYNCVFKNNIINSIAGVRVRVDEKFVADSCIFAGNVGTPILLHGGPMVISNCVFAGNIGGFNSSGIYSESQDTIIRNCTFSGNSNSSRFGGSALSLREGGEVSNCIFWDNKLPAIDIRQDEQLVSYCDVQGGWPGEGNIDVDPFFAMPGYWDQNGMPDDTSDDFWVDGDYHLKSEAGRWDPVSESWVIDDVTSPCIDAGDPLTPVMYEPHPRGYFINMGAYGGTEKASKSPLN
jgi:hypothetical protein